MGEEVPRCLPEGVRCDRRVLTSRREWEEEERKERGVTP
jgi:hypothetical protein